MHTLYLMTNSPLFPIRHCHTDFFICDIADAVIKDEITSMEHPIFVLTKQPYMKSRQYKHGNNWFEVKPSSKGIANIWDKDILIYAISQIMAAKNKNLPYSKNILFKAYDFLIFSNRNTGGKDYESLKNALERLDGTRLRTNINTDKEEEWKAFGLIESATIRKRRCDGHIIEWGITLSDWLFNAIEANEVLSISPDYFRLRKPLERRVYEIARKHCGQKKEWRISLELLQKKCGSSSPKRNFKTMLKEIVKHQHLPDYQVVLFDNTVLFIRTNNVNIEEKTKQSGINYAIIPPLRTTTYEKFREQFPNIDPYFIEQEWRDWAEKKEPPTYPDKAFLSFARMYLENQ